MDAVTTAAPNHSFCQRMVKDMTMRGFGEHTSLVTHLLAQAISNLSVEAKRVEHKMHIVREIG